MIFGPEMADKVLAGEKTETRRRGRGDQPCRYLPGRTYAVQRGRGMRSEGRIRIVSVRREPLWRIDEDGARREGFEDPIAFFRYWARLHGAIQLQERVWVIRFELEPAKPGRKKGGAQLVALGAGAL